MTYASHQKARQQAELQNLLLFMLKGGLDKRSRDAIGHASAAWVARNYGKPAEAHEITQTLRQRGLAPIDTGADIHAIHEHIIKLIPKERELSKRFQYYADADLRACPEVARLVTHEALISIAGDYLGCWPTISTVTCWWSHPSTEPPGGMQNFHHDRGDFRSVNLFIYLTDVTAETGPHIYVPETHDSTHVQMTNEWLTWFDSDHRKTGAEVLANCKEKPILILGKTGTAFFEDTRGLHKGLVPATGPRLCFEIVYTVLPKPNEIYTLVPLPIPDERSSGERYATRLIYE